MAMGLARFLGAGLLAGLLGVGSPAAQEPGRRPFALMGPDQGLLSGSVTCLTQDADGFLWMGTENGLVRYEGGHVRRWGPADGLPSAYVMGIVPRPGGGLWVATARGLVRFQDGRFDPVRLGAGSLANESATLALDAKGRLWAATAQGLFIQGEGLAFQAQGWKGAGALPVLAAGTASGAMYLVGPDGIQTFQGTRATRKWGPADGLPAEGPVLAMEDGAGRLWAGSGRTLVMLPPGGERFSDQSARLGASLSHNATPFRERDGSVWLPTQNGALRVGGESVEVLDAAGGLPFRWVRSIFRDREGTLWILGPALARLQGGGRLWNYTLSPGATGEVVWGITRDPQGRLLVATDDGAARMGPQGLTRLAGTEGHRIKALTTDPAGTLWMVSTLAPTLWLRPGRTQAETAPLGEFGKAANSVMVDSRQRLWLGHTTLGVMRWDPGTRKLIQEVAPGFAGAKVLGAYAMREDAAGRLWVGTTAGLLVREPQGLWRFFSEKDGLRPFTVHGMAFLADGSAWIHYQEPNGLTRVRLDGARLTVLEQRQRGQGLKSDLIYAVQVDDRGRTWVTTDQGLDLLDSPLHLGRRDGMVNEDCALSALLTEPGRIWVGTASGLVRYDSNGLEPVPDPPRAYVLRVATGEQGLEPPFAGLRPVPARDATVTFQVAAPAYADEQGLRFQVRLLGLESAWQGTQARVVRYPALPGGRYRFEVRAALGDGPFGPVGSFGFQVRPPWWGTWWARILGALAGFGGLLALLRLREASLARSKVALEALVAQRTLELSTKNEELQEALGNVKQLSGMLPICAHCKKIRDDGGYWNQLEHYITEHSEADFSHGICPECAKELYPEFTGKPRPPRA